MADYQPEQIEKSKIKKTNKDHLQLNLVPTVDIVSAVVEKGVASFVVGFAAETDDVANYAQAKMERKKLDMIAANHVGEGVGFAVDENALQVFWPEGSQVFPLAVKSQLARDLMTLIIERYNAKNSIKNS